MTNENKIGCEDCEIHKEIIKNLQSQIECQSQQEINGHCVARANVSADTDTLKSKIENIDPAGIITEYESIKLTDVKEFIRRLKDSANSDKKDRKNHQEGYGKGWNNAMLFIKTEIDKLSGGL
jgi:hypothetical protein